MSFVTLVQRMVADRLTELEQHVLTTVVDTKQVQVYRLGRPGTRIMSCQISFTPEGIAIQGDFTPTPSGVVSRERKDRAWFASPSLGMSPDYLATKFLESDWHTDLAVEELEQMVEQYKDDEPALAERCRAVLADMDEIGRGDQIGFSDLLSRHELELDELPGYGKSPRDAADLAAIQACFSRLWLADLVAPAPVPARPSWEARVCSECGMQHPVHLGTCHIALTLFKKDDDAGLPTSGM